MTDNNQKGQGVREILLRGVFWRILLIEAILLIFSLAFRWYTQGADATELFWYGLRIIGLVGVIITFMMVTLKKFLDKKIIAPLETISRANKKIQQDMSSVQQLDIPDNAPLEIKSIVSTRKQMLNTIFNVSEERLRLVNFIRDTFGRYLSKKVVDEILESPEGSQVGGSRKVVTILMSDLRGFTSISETQDPEQMVSLLNRYLERMSKIILKYDGIIDEIIGDAILAVFGAPDSHDDDPQRAIACAIEMQNSLMALNKDIETYGYPPLEMGIGINTGTVIAGTIGSEVRMKYGIVGTTVNTAARIESNSIGGQVLIGQSTFAVVKDGITAEPPKNIMMKGMKKPLVFYSVSAIDSGYNVSLSQPRTADVGLAIKLPFQCWTITDKKIDPLARFGETVRIEGSQIDAVLPMPLEPLTDVKINFDFCVDSHCFEDIYAKVASIEPLSDQSLHHLNVTSMNTADRNILNKWISEATI